MTSRTKHIGRSWGASRAIEDGCPCPKEPCGLVDEAKASPGCTEHPPEACKSIRQGHYPEDCPGVRPNR